MQKTVSQNTIPNYIPGTGLAVELVNIRNIHPHVHKDVLEFIFCLKGHVNVTLAHMKALISPGELVTIDVNDFHNLYSEEDNLVLIVDVSLQNTRIPIENLRSTIFACATILKDEIEMDYLEEICDKLLVCAYLKMKYDRAVKDGLNTIPYKEAFESIRKDIIDIMEYHFSWFKLEGLSVDDKKYEDRMRKIIYYVQNNCQRKINLPEIASVLHLHPTYISNFMKRTSFSSFTSLVYYFRCLYAQELLVTTDTSVGDIAELCGFSSENYFYRTFKSWWNTTPLQYRKYIRGFFENPEQTQNYSYELETDLIHYIADRQVALALKQTDYGLNVISHLPLSSINLRNVTSSL